MNNPEVTLVMLTYNNHEYIRDAVFSALDQDYEKLRIVISDDASTDSTVEIINSILETYKGKGSVFLNVNENNMGIGRHFAYIMDHLVKGELVIMSAGDDISKPNRVTRIVEEWLSNAKPSLVAHSLEEIDEAGSVIYGNATFQYAHQDLSVLENNLHAMREYQAYHTNILFFGCAVAYKVDTYKKFKSPLLYPDCEDHLMYFRALLDSGVHYFKEVLTSYRRHERSWTGSEEKPFSHISSAINDFYMRSDGYIGEKYLFSLLTHTIISQQWIDYCFAVKSGWVPVDYILVESIWSSLIRRHNYIISNKSDNFLDKHIYRSSEFKFINNGVDRVKGDFSNSCLFVGGDVKGLSYLPRLKCVIFGTSQAAYNVLKKSSPGFEFIYAVNTNEGTHGHLFCGLEVISLDSLKRIIQDIDCVVVASGYFFKIMRMLVEEAGIPSSKIVRIPASTLVENC